MDFPNFLNNLLLLLLEPSKFTENEIFNPTFIYQSMYVHMLFSCIYESYQCYLNVQNLFVKKGGTVLDNHQVIEIIPGPIVTVVTNKGSFQTKRLVIAAGAWAPSLCRTLGINLPLKVSCLQWKLIVLFFIFHVATCTYVVPPQLYTFDK